MVYIWWVPPFQASAPMLRMWICVWCHVPPAILTHDWSLSSISLYYVIASWNQVKQLTIWRCIQFTLSFIFVSCHIMHSLTGEFEDFNLIEAKVPILRFRDRCYHLEVDLNYNNSVGIKNTHLLYCYSQSKFNYMTSLHYPLRLQFTIQRDFLCFDSVLIWFWFGFDLFHKWIGV